MHRLLKLSSLITIIFYIFVWGGCGSEEPPESPKTVTKKKISAKPPTVSKIHVAQGNSTPPIPSQKTPIPTSMSKAEQNKSMPKDPEKTEQNKVPLPSDNKLVPTTVATGSKTPEGSKESAGTNTPVIAKKNKMPEPVLPAKTVPAKKEKISQKSSPTAEQPDSLKTSNKPKDTSEKTATEIDAPQIPKGEDKAPSDLKTDTSPSLTIETQDTQNEMHSPDIKAITSQVEEQLVPEKTTSSYDPKGRIDPFVPFIKKAEPTKGPAPVKQRHRGPLEKVDIDQLQLVGIIRAPSGNLALVQQASGKGYIIQKGTPIGIKEGHVAEILADQVVVEEKGVDSHNEPITVERLMKIKKPIGEL